MNDDELKIRGQNLIKKITELMKEENSTSVWVVALLTVLQGVIFKSPERNNWIQHIIQVMKEFEQNPKGRKNNE